MTKKLMQAVFAAAMMLYGAPAFAEDILDIYHAAVTNDPIFQSAVLIFQAKQEDPNSARARLLPNVGLHADGGVNHDKRDSSVQYVTEGDDTWPSYAYGATMTQPVYDRDLFLAYEQSKLTAQLAENDFMQARVDLILRVVDGYVGVLAAQDSLEFATAERVAISEQMELARDRLNVGLGTTTDLSEAKARFELAQATEIQAQQSLENAHQTLWELIGRRVEKLNKLREDTSLTPPDPADQEEWVRWAQQKNLALVAAGLNEEVSRRELSRQKSQRLPTLNFVVNYNVDKQQGSLTGGEIDSQMLDATLQLELPVFAGGGVSSAIRAALLQLQSAQMKTESAQRAATRDTRSAYLDVTTSVREVQALKQAVVASEESLEGKKQDYKAGLCTNLDVLNAQGDLFQAKRDYQVARYQYLTKMLTLYSVAGELDVDDLDIVNSWLE